MLRRGTGGSCQRLSGMGCGKAVAGRLVRSLVAGGVGKVARNDGPYSLYAVVSVQALSITCVRARNPAARDHDVYAKVTPLFSACVRHIDFLMTH